jgi:hypothetical protein
LLQVKLAALPGNTSEDSQACSLQTGVVVAGDQLHTAQAASFQALDFDGFEGSWHDGSGDCLVKPPASDSSIAHYKEEYKQGLSVSV